MLPFRHRNVRKDENDGKCPLFRPRSGGGKNTDEGWKENLMAEGWEKARRGGQSMRDTCKRFALDKNIHLKVITRGGNKMTRDLKSHPLRKGGCVMADCLVCSTGGKGTTCVPAISYDHMIRKTKLFLV